MGHSLGDAIIVLALGGVLVAYWYFRHAERQKRLEVVHQERLVAMDKGVPLPELPLDPPKTPKVLDPRDVLLHGIVWLAFGVGGMLMAAMAMPSLNGRPVWPFALPLALLGAGLVLYYALASNRQR